MDWKLAMEEERAALKRIAALLFALAGLAELACHRSPAVLGFVLWLRDFVGDAPDMPPAGMPLGPAGGSRAEAMRLAASFRALARLLDRQARLSFHGADRSETEARAFGRIQAVCSLLNPLFMFAALARRAPHPPLAPDTS